jgi:hypothetical protein
MVAQMSYRAIDIGQRAARHGHVCHSLPQLRWVAIADLVIDEDYQRPLTKQSWRQINQIAQKFDLAHFLPVLVAPSALPGKFSIIDGQHRTHAAMLVGMAEVPAQIVDLDEVGQARAFSAVNGVVTAVTAGHVFRAGLRAGEPWALATEAAVTKAGVRLVDYRPSASQMKPGHVYCVGWVRDEVKAGRGALVTQMLDALRRSSAGAEVYPWSRPFLRPFMLALVAVPRAQRRDLAAFLDMWSPGVMDRQAARLKRESKDPEIRTRTHSSLLTEIIQARLAGWVAEGGGG